jgi:hypothetical protein
MSIQRNHFHARHMLMHRFTRVRTSHARRDQGGRQLCSDNTAIGPQGMGGIRLRTATMRTHRAPLQAETKRQKHQPHKEDGHRNALERFPQHSFIVITGPLPSVIYVTCDDKPVANEM